VLELWRIRVDGRDRFAAEAAEHGRCTESGDFRKGNAAYDAMTAALKELRERADRGEAPLLELLNHPNNWVKLAAATHLLPLRPELASEVLEKLASGPRSEARFDARIVLRQWRSGKLKVP
jgi:hypothetical protein